MLCRKYSHSLFYELASCCCMQLLCLCCGSSLTYEVGGSCVVNTCTITNQTKPTKLINKRYSFLQLHKMTDITSSFFTHVGDVKKHNSNGSLPNNRIKSKTSTPSQQILRTTRRSPFVTAAREIVCSDIVLLL